MNEKQRKEHELRSRMMQKVAYYEQGGVKLPVVQNRLPNASRKPGLWMNPYEGEYKIAFDGLIFLRIPDTYEAKMAKIGNFWTF